MPKKRKHYTPIVDAAVTLFRQQGYAATGLNDIVEASRAPKGSLYYYFPDGKISIAVAAIDEAGERVARTLQELSDQTASTGELLLAHAQLLARWMRQSGYRDGCPITTVLLELAPRARQVTQAGRRAYASRNGVIRKKLEADGFASEHAARLAQLCTSSLNGALIQARVERSGEPLIIAADELAKMIAREAIKSRSDATKSK